MTAVTVLKDLRAEFGEARNQGPRPTCLAFAASDAHAALRPGWSPLSCEFAFYHAQRRAGRPASSGAVMPTMLATLRGVGQPEEAGWPYLAATPADPASWTPPADVGTRFGRAGASLTPTVDAVIAAIDAGRPVILLILLSGSFYAPDPDGVIRPAVGEAPDPAIRHAVLAVAHGMIAGERLILIRNSWGASWGVAGHGWLTESFLIPRVFAAVLLTESVDVSAYSAAV